MLAEARKYRVALTLAHQNLTQMPRELLAATSANARNKIYFTCAPRDARDLEEHTLPELDRHDLAHLDTYTVAARLMADGRQTPAFTLTTRPMPPPAWAAAVIRQAAADAVPTHKASGIDTLITRLSRPPRDRRPRRDTT